MKRTYRLLTSLVIYLSTCFALSAQTYKADVVIYGGTSAGIAAAVEVSRSGYTVLVISPDIHIGGLSSNGLGYTDTGDKTVIGGISKEFYKELFAHFSLIILPLVFLMLP